MIKNISTESTVREIRRKITYRSKCGVEFPDYSAKLSLLAVSFNG